MGEGGGETDKTRGGGGRKIEGEGVRDGDGERHTRRVVRNLLTEKGVAAIAIAVAATATVRVAAQKRSQRIRQHEAERDERDRGDAEERGRKISARQAGIWIARARGAVMPALKKTSP